METFNFNCGKVTLEKSTNNLIPAPFFEKNKILIDLYSNLYNKGDYLYQTNEYLDAYHKSYGKYNENIIFLTFFNNNFDFNDNCFATLILRVNTNLLRTYYVNAGILFGNPKPLIYPGMELQFLNLLFEFLKCRSKFFTAQIGPTTDTNLLLVTRKNLTHTKSTSSPYINLLSYQKPYSERLVQNLRNIENRIIKNSIHVDVKTYYDPNDPNFLEIFELFKANIKKRFPEGHFMKDEKRHTDFYLNFAKNLSKSNSFIFKVLMISKKPAAFCYGVLLGDTFYYFTNTFSEEFKEFSPSNLLISRMVSEFKMNGIIIFDFMNDEEIYKLRWTSTRLPRFVIEMSSHRFLSENFLEKIKLIGLLRKLKYRLLG